MKHAPEAWSAGSTIHANPLANANSVSNVTPAGVVAGPVESPDAGYDPVAEAEFWANSVVYADGPGSVVCSA